MNLHRRRYCSKLMTIEERFGRAALSLQSMDANDVDAGDETLALASLCSALLYSALLAAFKRRSVFALGQRASL